MSHFLDLMESLSDINGAPAEKGGEVEGSVETEGADAADEEEAPDLEFGESQQA